jgi:hypothetical protein
MMTDGIQADRRKEAEKARLAQAYRSSRPNLREVVGNFIIFIGLKVKSGIQQAKATGEIQAYPETEGAGSLTSL